MFDSRTLSQDVILISRSNLKGIHLIHKGRPFTVGVLGFEYVELLIIDFIYFPGYGQYRGQFPPQSGPQWTGPGQRPPGPAGVPNASGQPPNWERYPPQNQQSPYPGNQQVKMINIEENKEYIFDLCLE